MFKTQPKLRGVYILEGDTEPLLASWDQKEPDAMQTSTNLGIQVIQLAQGQPLEGEKGLKCEHPIYLSQHLLLKNKK